MAGKTALSIFAPISRLLEKNFQIFLMIFARFFVLTIFVFTFRFYIFRSISPKIFVLNFFTFFHSFLTFSLQFFIFQKTAFQKFKKTPRKRI